MYDYLLAGPVGNPSAWRIGHPHGFPGLGGPQLYCICQEFGGDICMITRASETDPPPISETVSPYKHLNTFLHF